MCDRQPSDAGEGFDLLGHCSDKVDFLAGLFTHGQPGDGMNFDSQEIAGLYWILEDLGRDLAAAEAVISAEMKRRRA